MVARPPSARIVDVSERASPAFAPEAYQAFLDQLAIWHLMRCGSCKRTRRIRLGKPAERNPPGRVVGWSRHRQFETRTMQALFLRRNLLRTAASNLGLIMVRTTTLDAEVPVYIDCPQLLPVSPSPGRLAIRMKPRNALPMLMSQFGQFLVPCRHPIAESI